jgi:hypothetical protein
MIVPVPIVVDFEFGVTPGSTPRPHTMCAKDRTTGVTHIYEGGRLRGLVAPPFPPDYTLIAFAADAELSCYEILGWPYRRASSTFA